MARTEKIQEAEVPLVFSTLSPFFKLTGVLVHLRCVFVFLFCRFQETTRMITIVFLKDAIYNIGLTNDNKQI